MTTHRNRCATALIALLTPLLAGLPASGATVLYQTGFEPPTFQAGSPLNGQGGFLGFLNEDVATVSTGFPRSGSQSVKVDGALMEPFLFGSVDGYYFTRLNYDALAGGTPIINVSVDVALDAAPNVASAAGFETDEGSLFAKISLESDGSNGFVSAYTVDDYVVGPAISFGQYYTLGIKLDYGSRTAEFSIDGTSFAALAISDEMGSLFGSASLFLQGDYPLPSVAYFDNYSITAVPEPGTFSLLGMGVLAVLGYARVRHRRPLGAEVVGRTGPAFPGTPGGSQDLPESLR